MATQKSNNEQYILKVTCTTCVGIIAGVTNFLAERGCYISELAQYNDPDSQGFFLRACFYVESGGHDVNSLQREFPKVAERFDMDWYMCSEAEPTRTVIMVSKFDHCLDDLLYRKHKGELNMDITAVVSNHLDLRSMVEREGIRFVHLPVTKENKPTQERALLDIVEETNSDLVILARYMQILSDETSQILSGRAINIHHSFLPGFKGAKPYHQAHARGVKLIGATAHYVTSDLDEGPIIEQSVQPVDHTYTSGMLVATGRDTETVALARAVKLHTEHRVFLDGNKTVIFR